MSEEIGQAGPSDPAFWQARYEAGEAHWDKGAPAPALVEYLLRHPVVGRVLVPGCGAGHDVRALASQGAEVVGMDFAAGAMRSALEYPCAGSVHFEQADFLKLPEKWHGVFDWIFEHTCFCAIDPKTRGDYVRACCQALKSGGKILAVFYVNPDQDDPNHPPFPSPLPELDAWFGKSFDVLSEWVPGVSYPGREGRELVRVLSKR
jgi:SAM-dependent methyltransferase